MPSNFPISVAPDTVKVKKVWASTRFDNPVQLSSQVQLRSGMRYEIDVTMQKMGAELAAEFTQFLENLQGGFGTFNFDLDPWCPGLSPAPGVRVFRLAANEHGWDARMAVEFSFSFVAVEVV